MTPDQHKAMRAYVAAYLVYEHHSPHVTLAERHDLNTDIECAQIRALALGVSLEALQEAAAMALPETTSKPLR